MLRPLLLAACLTGVSLAAPYTDAKYGFTATPPEGWQQRSYEGTAVVFMNPKPFKDFSPNLNVVVASLPSGLTREQFHQINLEQIKKVVTDGKVLQVRAATLGGQPGYEVVYTGRQGTYDLYFMAIYAVKGQTAYVVTGTTVIGAQSEMAMATRAFARSFKLTR